MKEIIVSEFEASNPCWLPASLGGANRAMLGIASGKETGVLANCEGTRSVWVSHCSRWHTQLRSKLNLPESQEAVIQLDSEA